MTRTTRHGGRQPIGSYALSAVVVEKRRYGGRWRQRFVAHLATIQVWENGRGDIAVGTEGKAHPVAVTRFWSDVDRKLDGLEGRVDRHAIEAMVSARVPRLNGAVPAGALTRGLV